MSADTKISALTALPDADLSGSVVVPAVAAGSTYKISLTQITAQVSDGLTLGTASTYDVGVGGIAVPLMSNSNTWSDYQVVINGVKVKSSAGAGDPEAIFYSDATGKGYIKVNLQSPGNEKTFSFNTDGTITAPGGFSGVVVGPGSSTDNAIARWDGTTGSVIQDSSVTVSDTGTLSAVNLYATTGNVYVGSNGGSIRLGASEDVQLYRDGAAATLAQRNGTNAQTFRNYHTYTDSSNYERLSFTWSATIAEIGTEALGTGTKRSLALGGNSIYFRPLSGSTTAAWQMTNAGHVVAVADNTYDIGASGATRPRNLYVAGSITFGSGASSSTIRTGTNTTNPIAVGDVYSAYAEVTLTDAATIAVDMSTFLNARVTLGGNRTLGNPTNAKVGQSGYIAVVQDGTGSRTLSFSSNWKREGGAPTLSTAAGTVDYIFYQVITTSLIVYSLVKAPT